MQLLDDDHHPDGQAPDTTAGALYGMMSAPWCKAVRPPGFFNTACLVVRGDQVEHWLNEELVLAYDLNSVTFAAAVARSKFTNLPGFAREVRGHIALPASWRRCVVSFSASLSAHRCGMTVRYGA